METTINHHHNHLKNNKKLSKVLSTKLSIEDYNAFLTLTKLEYEAGLIKEQSPSELLRFTIRRLLNQLRNNRIYHLLEQQQQQKHVQNNQQQAGQFNSQSNANDKRQVSEPFQKHSHLETPKTISSGSVPSTKSNVAYDVGNC
jgi:hypothetical protein